MSDKLQALVAGALTNVRNPRVDNDVISAGMVQSLDIDSQGSVSITFVLGRDDPATLVREIRKAVRAVEGVRDVEIDVIEPTGSQAPSGAQARGGSTLEQAPSQQPKLTPKLGTIIAVSSGKGGVGKSTIAANLAVALVGMGKRVGIMDADIYGPNIPRIFGVSEQPPVVGGKVIPLESHGVKLISIGLLIERDAPAIWRGPIVVKVISQFLEDVDWGELDYFIVDLPPGTGDAQLSLTQTVRVKGAIIVTTPQEMAVGDALRGAKMFEKVAVPVLGIVENMSYFCCPHCGEQSDVFMNGGGQRLADELDVKLLGRVPLQAGLADLADGGEPVVIAAPDSPASKALSEIARNVIDSAGGKAVSLPVITG
ncbi:MAG: Mrp/NBP35 family ATP-binding protein [Gemmatimonadota bacterium]|nr:MAG: Mrp/NBP35 family ATP-binding protein [Gemmatimonadota bacterium]